MWRPLATPGVDRSVYDPWLERACGLGLKEACGFVFEVAEPSKDAPRTVSPGELGTLSQLPREVARLNERGQARHGCYRTFG